MPNAKKKNRFATADFLNKSEWLLFIIEWNRNWIMEWKVV